MAILSNRYQAAREEASEYIRSILDMLGERDPLAVLAETPDDVESIVRDLSDAQLRQPEAPGKWSLVEVVQHLADSELVWGWRLRMTLAHDRPAITGYDQDAWASRLRYAATPLADALDQLRVLRRIHLRIVGSLSDAERARVGVHSERGDESVAKMMRLYAGHDLVHRRQMRRIRAAIGG
jgi:uncharacterized damage-inducible protein DinB